MFHTSHCNILSKTDQIEKENPTKHHLPQRVFMERLCCSCSKKKELEVKIIWKDTYKLDIEYALRNQEYGAPFAKPVCVSSHVLKLFIWTNKTFISSLYEF